MGADKSLSSSSSSILNDANFITLSGSKSVNASYGAVSSTLAPSSFPASQHAPSGPSTLQVLYRHDRPLYDFLFDIHSSRTLQSNIAPSMRGYFIEPNLAKIDPVNEPEWITINNLTLNCTLQVTRNIHDLTIEFSECCF